MIIRMMTIHLPILVIIANVATAEVTNTTEDAVSPEPKNAFRFDEQPDTPHSYGLVRFEGENNQLPYNSDLREDTEIQRIKFKEDNTIQNQRPSHQKKKRRRRRPRQKVPSGGPGFQNGGLSGYPTRPSPAFPGQFYPGQSAYPQGYPGQFYRPRPSAPSTALTAVTDALGSIAQYDDRQCVARLLCEAAGGAGGAGVAGGAGSGLLQAITGLQPLLTILAAYNGVSSSPLFVFGRAVFLGMTSKANPGTCRYAYPDCPTDPEQLVHYLNNHNGGFFRFFAAPELNQQQNLEQFYNQLSGQNYGYYQPQQNSQNGYGHLQNYPNPPLDQQNFQYQPYPNQNQQQGFYQNQYSQQGDYLQQQNLQNIGYQRPSPYDNRYGLYGQNYPHQQNNNYMFKNAKIEKRIQNTRDTELFSNNNVFANPKWIFPGDSRFTNKDVVDNVRLGKVLKFPQNNMDSDRAASVGFVFPGSQSNRDYTSNNIEAIDDNEHVFENPTPVNNFRHENRYNYAIEADDDINMNGVRILYVVRGNGDPNNPEVVRLEPGQTI